MSPDRQSKFIGLIELILIILTLWVGWWFYSSEVETVLSVDEVRCGWLLSPKGDKVIYGSNLMFLTQNYAILMFLATNQKYTIREGCSSYGWLDNTTLFFPFENVLVDTNDRIETSYKVINASEANLEALLREAGTIYADRSDSSSHEKVYSPNGAYYYRFEGDMITIYDAKDDKKLSQTPTNDVQRYQIGGWAADSSGVYYQLVPGGFMGRISGLYKLKVPQPFPFW